MRICTAIPTLIFCLALSNGYLATSHTVDSNRNHRLLLAQAPGQDETVEAAPGTTSPGADAVPDTTLQDAPGATATTGAGDATTQLVNECVEMLHNRQYEELVDRLTPVLRQQPQPDPRLVEIHGVALSLLGDFEDAERELASLGDYAPARAGGAMVRFRPAAVTVQFIQSKRRFFPPHMETIKMGDTVRFHVYYDEMTDWTRQWMSILPAAYEDNSKLLGRDFAPITILLFHNYEGYINFMTSGRGGRPGALYARAHGSSEAVEVNYYNGYRQPMPALPPIYAHATMAHEMNHHLVMRMLGSYSLPRWFLEGLAVWLQGQVRPAQAALEGQNIVKFVQHDGILSLEDLTGSFSQVVGGNTHENAAAAAKWRNSNAYDQGYSMVFYFLHKLKPGDLPHFLYSLRDAKNKTPGAASQATLDAAFKQYIGEGLDDFYADWLKVIAPLKQQATTTNTVTR